MYLMDTDYGMGGIFLHNGLIDDVDNSRKPAFDSFKTMIEKVDYFTGIEKLDEGQYKYTFSNKDPVYVLWCDEEPCQLTTEIFSSTAKFKVTDYLGNEQQMFAGNIELNESPIFVE